MEQGKRVNLAGSGGGTEADSNYFTFSLIYNDKDKSRPEFEVISFTGTENLSFVYDFNITLRSKTDDIPSLLENIILRPAALCIVVENHFAYYHGIVAEFRQVMRVGDYTQYELRLRAKPFLPYLNTRSNIHVGNKFGEIINSVMQDNGFTTLDYELKLTGNHYEPLSDGYNRWSFVCQYEENDLDFLQRLMEREGVYYYFTQDQTWRESLQQVQQEKMIIVDSKGSHSPAAKTLLYRQAGSPGSGPDPETIFTLIMHQAAFPTKVVLRNYNYDAAKLGIMSATADVGPKTEAVGRVQTIYGENFSTPVEGQTLAGIRAEEIYCQTKVYYGMASGPGLIPGTLITIKDSGQTFSGDYQIIHADHTGKQPLPGIEEEFEYNNTFTMIPAAVQFRPQRLTPKPKIHAAMNAVIDGDMSTENPDIDATFGRYKVRIPFAPDDASNNVNAKWGKSTDKYHVRMASPYAGTEPDPEKAANVYGMHMPLHKGAEVVLSFRDGDPDLPVISGAVYNSQNLNVVTDKNRRQHVIQTQGGNKFVMDDTPGKEYISLFSPYGKEKGSWMYIGHGAEEEGLSHIKNSGAKHELTLGQEDSFVIGSENWVTIGSKLEALLGTSSEFTMAMKSVFEWAGTIECKAGHHLEFGKTTERIKDKDDLLGTDSIKIAAGLPPGEKAVLSKLQNAVVFGGAALGALIAAGAGDLGAINNPTGDDADQVWQQAVTTSSALVVGTGAQLAALIYLVKKLNKELTNAISTIDMDNQGIKIQVKKDEAPEDFIADLFEANPMQGSINLSITRGATDTASIKIAGNNQNRDSITMEKAPDGGKITINEAGTVINKHTGNNVNTSINLATDNIIMEKATGGKVTVNATGGIMEVGTAKTAVTKTPNVENSDKAELVVGANGFTTTALETKMVFAGKAIKINAGSVDIGNGAVTIVAA